MPFTDGKHYVRPELGIPDRGAATIIEVFRVTGHAIPDPTTGPPTGDPVIARLELGRWLGDCLLRNPATGDPNDPGTWASCGNAQFIDFTDPRFYCVACHNAILGGRWRPVTLPPNRAAIEASVDGKPAAAQEWPPRIAVKKPVGPIGPGERHATPEEMHRPPIMPGQGGPLRAGKQR